MTKETEIHPIKDLKFWLFCLCGFSGGYLMFEDRVLSLDAIWNFKLLFLLGPFVFGIIYKSEFLAISFWLFLALGIADLIKGIPAGMVGASYWGGIVVCLLTLPAGLAGWGSSFLIPKANVPGYYKKS